MIGPVALFRPIDDARRSAALLRARGLACVLAPAMRIESTGVQPPNERFDAVVATSAHAFASLDADARASLAGVRSFVVGEQTAAAALAAGLDAPDAIEPDARALAAMAQSRLSPGSRLLYLAARDRKPGLEANLARAGHSVVVVEVYAARARGRWSPAESEGFSTCAAALHYSRRSAILAAQLAEGAAQGEHFRAILHVCISMDAAEPLLMAGVRQTIVATGARETLLLDALSATLQPKGKTR